MIIMMMMIKEEEKNSLLSSQSIGLPINLYILSVYSTINIIKVNQRRMINNQTVKIGTH